MSGVGMMMLGSGGDLVKISNATISSVNSGGNASAAYRISSTGSIDSVRSPEGTTSLGSWVVPTTSASKYEAMATVTSGSLSLGTTGSFINCSASPMWTRNATVVGTFTAVITVDIRLIGTTTVLTTASITLTAERQP
jgi:hypothetical protein